MRMIREYPVLMGITRLADITGLDRLGIPVVQAIRPLALSNAVSQGKGADVEAASLSAVMEAAETFFAEQVSRIDTVTACAADLGVATGLFDRHLLPGSSPAWRRAELPWVEAADLISGEPGWVPLELVHTVFVHPPLETDGHFLASTSGLAAALRSSDATLHGLLECVERDALARAHRTHGFFHRNRLDIKTIEHAETADLIEDVRSKGILIGLWTVEGAGGLPVIWCQLMEDGSRETIMPYPADGFAASLDPFSAVQRAISEAAQSRLAAISGSRDDITRASYPRYTDWQSIDAHRRLLADGPTEIEFDAIIPKGPLGGNEWLETIAGRLSEDGISSILIADIKTEPLSKIRAVRVVVPQLEPLTEGS
jgi:ribosomal protein S12 methylthiotransferase accessory factor